MDPVECKKYCDNEVGCSNIAYPWLVMTLLPVGKRHVPLIKNIVPVTSPHLNMHILSTSITVVYVVPAQWYGPV